MIQKQMIHANGTGLNVLTAGQGETLVLLHGWPEFAAAWRPLITQLAGDFRLIAPDFRGFGDSETPDPGPTDRVNASLLADDILALLDTMGETGPIGFVSHDVGAYVAQLIAQEHPERVSRLFFFDCPYPGIGARWSAPGHLAQIWYQTFNQTPLAAEIVGASSETLRAYLGHFLRNWAGNPTVMMDRLEEWVEVFSRPGVLQGGFNWYIGNHKARLAVMAAEPSAPKVINHPTRILWGEKESVLPAAWMDRLPEYFSDLTASLAEGCGHFVHCENPDLAAREIRAFFGPAQR